MLETLILFCLAALALVAVQARGVLDPFLLFFSVWSVLFFSYWLALPSLNPLSNAFTFGLTAMIISASAIAISCRKGTRKQNFTGADILSIEIRRPIFLILQCATICALFPTLLIANNIAGDAGIFSQSGFVKIRIARVTGENPYGWLNYFFPLSAILCSVATILHKQNKLHLFALLVSVIVAVSFSFLSTGRTSFLFLIIVIVAPLLLTRAIGTLSILNFAILGCAGFLIFSAYAGKGLSFNDGQIVAASLVGEIVQGYTIAPLGAMNYIFNNNEPLEYGQNTFRFVISVLYKLELSNLPPQLLVKDFVYIPIQTNVFTVLEPYVRDFHAAGFFFPPLFLLIHNFFHRQAFSVGGIYVFLYSASLYPLLMQFFADQYFSLLSLWVQVLAFYWILVRHFKTHNLKRPLVD